MKHLAKQENKIRVNYLSILSKVNNVNSFLFFFLAGVGMGERQRNDNCTKSADLMEREKKILCSAPDVKMHRRLFPNSNFDRCCENTSILSPQKACMCGYIFSSVLTIRPGWKLVGALSISKPEELGTGSLILLCVN